MWCNCSKLPEIVKLEDHPRINRGKQIDSGDWVRLVRCPRCSQLWSVDEWDKYQIRFAIKIPCREGWREFDSTPLRKEYLIRSCGGLTDERCIFVNCDQPRVRGVVYCADHLYAVGARE